MKVAILYDSGDASENTVRCRLCPHNCTIKEGRRGVCNVRENRSGTLYSLVSGTLCSTNIDPIEKKPIFHMLPGSRSLSISTVGCNLKCLHCQNHTISQFEGGQIPGERYSPEDIIAIARRAGCESISYTYTEPTIFMEFAYDCSRLAHEAGMKNIFVSNGFMSREAAGLIAPYLDADNIDLKGGDEFYRKVCKARLAPIEDTIGFMRKGGVWVEVTTLLIPGLNDSDEILKGIARFIHSIDPAIPWHVSRFHPTYRLMDRPVTPISTLKRARAIGLETGLKYVYSGNIPGDNGEHTYCPKCNNLLIERQGFYVIGNKINGGRCNTCNAVIDGVWR